MVAQVGRFGPRASAVAKGQVRSNREKKKRTADTNKIKAAPTASPFAAPRFARHGSGAAGPFGRKIEMNARRPVDAARSRVRGADLHD